MPGKQLDDPAKHGNDPVSNLFLAKRLLTQGMYQHTDIFNNIPVTADKMKTDSNLLDDLITACKGNSQKIKERDAQSEIVNADLTLDLLYAKLICNHDITMIELSGFDSKYQPEKLPIPDSIGISKIIDGKEEGTYKIIPIRKKIKKMAGQAPKAPRRTVKFDVDISSNPQDPTLWVSIMHGQPSTKLIIKSTDVIPNKKNYVRMYTVNSAGRSKPSVTYFSPKIQ